MNRIKYLFKLSEFMEFIVILMYTVLIMEKSKETLGSFKVAKGSHYLFPLTFPLCYFLG
jgi:uncharacterized Tic20 family protein